MTLLLFYLMLAILVSFFCSIAEAVILSVRPSYVTAMESTNIRSANRLKKLRKNVDRPLAAILTANTIAHTVGAAGVGAQASIVFGSQYLGITSAILTFLILIFSEIIPKTLGATYWKQLAPLFAILIEYLTRILFPFVWMSEKITRIISSSKLHDNTFSRDEIEAMAQIGEEEGVLQEKELKIVSNLMRLQKLSVRDIMTPRTVIFSAPEKMEVKNFFEQHAQKPFSRIPIYNKNHDDITGYVLKSDLLIEQAKDCYTTPLLDFKRPFHIIPDKINASEAFDILMHEKTHIALVADEYGSVEGVVTLEDVVETLIGLEIIDELDNIENMQKYARDCWKKRMKSLGINHKDL